MSWLLLLSHAWHLPPRSFCLVPSPRTVRAPSWVGGPLGAHSRDPAPQGLRASKPDQRVRTAWRRGPGPGHPVLPGAGAQTGGAARRPRGTALAGDPRPPSARRTSRAGGPSAGEGEAPPREHRVRPKEAGGLAALRPPQSPGRRVSPGSGGMRPGPPGWLPSPRPHPSSASPSHLN